jgi:hypothetical protein
VKYGSKLASRRLLLLLRSIIIIIIIVIIIIIIIIIIGNLLILKSTVEQVSLVKEYQTGICSVLFCSVVCPFLTKCNEFHVEREVLVLANEARKALFTVCHSCGDGELGALAHGQLRHACG